MDPERLLDYQKHPGGGCTGPVTAAHLAPQPSAKSKSRLSKTDKHSKDNPNLKKFFKNKKVILMNNLSEKELIEIILCILMSFFWDFI